VTELWRGGVPKWKLGNEVEGLLVPKFPLTFSFPNFHLGTHLHLKLRFENAHDMRSRYQFTDAEGIHFLTCTIVEWLPVFTRPAFCDVVLNSLAYCRREKSMRLYAYVIMDNHVHLVADAPNLPRVIQAFKGFTAREILRVARESKRDWLLNLFAHFKKTHKEHSTHQVWQEGSHPQLIQNEAMLRQKIEYIHTNPVRCGWVDMPEHWRNSSARNYLKLGETALEIDDCPE